MNNMSGDPPLRWWEVLVGIGLFLLAILWESSGGLLPDVVNKVALIAIFIFLVAVFLAGIFKGLPRWCLPSLGLFLGAFVMIAGTGSADPLLGRWSNQVVRVGDEASRLAWQAILSGLFWGFQLLILFLFVLILLLLPPLRPIYRRFRKDWTLVSFTLYGAVLFSFFINWDEYTHEQAFVAACNLFLAIGAGGYLLSITKTSRLAWLMGGAALAMITMSLVKFVLVPLQDWPMWFQWHSKGAERWFESLRALIELGWMLLALIASSVLNLLPLAKKPAVEIPDSTKRAVENPVGSASPS